MNIGIFEILAIVFVAVFFFGATRLPRMGRTLGEALRGLKKGMNDDDRNRKG
jgi:sec-independent protein translocase protein TatA